MCRRRATEKEVRPRILIADDDRDTAEMLADLLGLHGFRVKVAFNGEQAVDLARSFKPGLAILDISMPVLNGYEAAWLMVNEHGVERPVLLALTSHASVVDVEFARQAGFDHHVAKGGGSDMLLALINRIVVAHRLDEDVIRNPTSKVERAAGEP